MIKLKQAHEEITTLQRWRHFLNITRGELAEAANLATITIVDWELHATKPRYCNLNKVCTILNGEIRNLGFHNIVIHPDTLMDVKKIEE